ncbi:hypothetical protein FNU76_00490 [Chitinimonas arctica]|uniref:Uncharacterized protein n=1 Tax=Chitinimonas arctica TaxID=2594795 RepID=A0A516S9W5_9NEIS|nr:hypothetical protein [Chitinimonas arctica]QDQ24944.1 hypothetical protein FNU76_00490 [Chitinimonas arctica]
MKNHIITNLKTIISSVVMLLLGILLLVISEVIIFPADYTWIKPVVSNLGGLLVATLSIALMWELFSKRSFLNEILEKTGLADEIKLSGLIGISTNPVKGPDFSKLIKSAERLDIFVCYANTWRATHEEDLKFLAKKKGCRIRLIIPNPDNAEIMKDLTRRFDAPSEQQMSERIKSAISEYKSLFAAVNNSTLDFSIWIHDENPVTSFYRFDRIAVLTLYKHARGRGNVPTLISDRDGSLYNYVESEIDAMIKGGMTNRHWQKKYIHSFSSSWPILGYTFRFTLAFVDSVYQIFATSLLGKPAP